MKDFEIDGVQEMSYEELKQTDGGILPHPLGAVVVAVAALVCVAVYCKGYHDGKEDAAEAAETCSC